MGGKRLVRYRLSRVIKAVVASRAGIVQRENEGLRDYWRVAVKLGCGAMQKSLKRPCRAEEATVTFLDMLLGYARVSADDQATSFQLDALKAAGCESTFSECSSGASVDRSVLAKVLSHSREGDTLVVWRLDRLGRSLPHLIETVKKLESAGVALKSLTNGIDTITLNGRLIFHLFGALAQFERDLIREWTMAGIAAARAKGRKCGRLQKLSAEKLRAAQRLLMDPEASASKVVMTRGVHRLTLHKALRANNAKLSSGVGRAVVRAG